MRMSQLFSQTLREAPGDAEVASHQLLLRAGFIRQLASGIFSYLPLARRSMDKIEGIISRQAAKELASEELDHHWKLIAADMKSSERLQDGRYEQAVAALRWSGRARSATPSGGGYGGGYGGTSQRDPLFTGSGTVF